MNENLIQIQSSAKDPKINGGLDLAQDGREYADTLSTRFGRVQVNEVKFSENVIKVPGGNGDENEPRLGSFSKKEDELNILKKGASSQEAISTDMMTNWSKMQEEYMHENEKEVPAHSSTVIHHVLHPFQDLIQDSFTHLAHENPEAALAEESMGKDLANLIGKTLTKPMIGGGGRKTVDAVQQMQQEHRSNIDANAFEYLVVLEELQFATEHIEAPSPSGKKNEDLRLSTSGDNINEDEGSVRGNGNGGDMADVRHLEKYPLRLNLVRGESVAHVPEQAFERKPTQMRKQTVNMKKSVTGDVIVAQASGVNMIVEEQKKRNESVGSKKSQFSI